MAAASWGPPPRSWGVRQSRSPQVHDSMSGVVAVLGPHGRGFSYILFKQPMVDALARRMQYGVSPLHPCHLRVFHVAKLSKWRLFCHYIGSPVGVLLHEYTEQPSWLGKIHKETKHVEDS